MDDVLVKKIKEVADFATQCVAKGLLLGGDNLYFKIFTGSISSIAKKSAVYVLENIHQSSEDGELTQWEVYQSVGSGVTAGLIEFGSFVTIESALTAITIGEVGVSGGTLTLPALTLWGAGTIANFKYSSAVGSAANKLIFNSLEYGPTVISIATAMFKASHGDSAYSQFFNQTPEGTLNTKIITITDDNQIEVQAELHGDSGKQVLHLQNIDGAEKEFVFEQKLSIEQILQNVKGSVFVTTDGTITASTSQLVDDYRAERTIDNVFLVGEDDYVSVKELDVLVSLKDYTKVISQFPGGGIDSSAMAPLSMFSNIATDMHIDMQNLLALRGNEYLSDRMVTTILGEQVVVLTSQDILNITPMSSMVQYTLKNISLPEKTLEVNLHGTTVTATQAIQEIPIDPALVSGLKLVTADGFEESYFSTDGDINQTLKLMYDGEFVVANSDKVTVTNAANKPVDFVKTTATSNGFTIQQLDNNMKKSFEHFDKFIQDQMNKVSSEIASHLNFSTEELTRRIIQDLANDGSADILVVARNYAEEVVARGGVLAIVKELNFLDKNWQPNNATFTNAMTAALVDFTVTSIINSGKYNIMFFKLNNSNFILLGEQNNGESLFVNKSEWWAENVA